MLRAALVVMTALAVGSLAFAEEVRIITPDSTRADKAKKAVRQQQGVPSPFWSPLENTDSGVPPVVRLDPSLPERPPSRR